MKASRLSGVLRACVLALSLSVLPLALPALAQNSSPDGSAPAAQSSRQTTTTTTTQSQASQPAQTTRVVERDSAASPTLYWVIGLAVLALVVIVAIVALGKRSNRAA